MSARVKRSTFLKVPPLQRSTILEIIRDTAFRDLSAVYTKILIQLPNFELVLGSLLCFGTKMNSYLLQLILYFSSLFPLLNRVLTSEIESVAPEIKWDPRGYVFYCPCMGKIDSIEVPFVIQRTPPLPPAYR